MTAKAAKYPQNVSIVRGFTWLLPRNALSGLKKVKTERRIAYPEAKKIVNMNSVPKPHLPSYASTLKAP